MLYPGIPWIAETECKNNKHCAVIFDQLVRNCLAALGAGISEAEIRSGVERLIDAKELFEAFLLGQHLLYPKRFYHAEQDVILCFKRMCL